MIKFKMEDMKCCSCSLKRKYSFISMIFLTATFFFVEIIVGYVTNSMALVADSFHMLSDVVSLLVGYIALKYSRIDRHSSTYTFGWARAEVLGALVNSVFLIALCFSIFVKALKRLIITEHLDNPTLVLYTGGVGLFVNVVGLFLFHQHGHGHSHGSHTTAHHHSNMEENTSLLTQDEDTAYGNNVNTKVDDDEVFTVNKDTTHSNASASQLNIRGVYLHVLGDALGSVIVMISAIIVLNAKGEWIAYVDPIMSIVMVIIILKTSIPLLRESSLIMMQTVPTHIKVQDIQDRLVQKVPAVLSVHEFHVWQLAGNKIIASAHVRCKTMPEYMAVANQIKDFFHAEGIHSTTIQPEFDDMSDTSAGKDTTHELDVDDTCILVCDDVCSEKMCCANSSVSTADEI